MPFNGNGKYIAPAGNPVVTGTVIQSTWANALVNDLSNALSNTLTRDGQSTVTGPFKITDGTVGAPALAFNSDAATGIFKPTATSLAIATMGREALRAINGNIIIPGKLEVNGAVPIDANSSALSVRYAGGNEVYGIALKADTDNTQAISFFNAANQPVGRISQTATNIQLLGLDKLTVNARNNADGLVVAATGITNSQVNIGVGYLTAGRPFVGTNTNSNPLEFGTRLAQPTIFVTDSAERARITATGNLLLGTTNDNGDKLQVNGSASVAGRLDVLARSVLRGGTGNDYNTSAIEINGGGSTNATVKPTLGFHQRDLYAGSLQQVSATDFAFYQQGGTAVADLTVRRINADDVSLSRNGFATTAFVNNVRNPIWRFNNSPDFGISYFQGTSSFEGGTNDSIGVHFGTLNGGAPTGPLSHVTFTRNGVIAKRFQGLADQSNNLKVTDPEPIGLSRGLQHITPNSVNSNIRADFATGVSVGTAGIYAGVLTFSPYDGRTASTGGPSYQLAFGSTQNNGGTPQLRLRNGIDTTWNNYIDVVTSANINQFSTGGVTAGRNLIVNGNFLINQRRLGLQSGPVNEHVYTGSATTVLNAGLFDFWRAGNGGVNLSFARTVTNDSLSGVTVTINSGSIRQLVRANELRLGTYVLSWVGTATATFEQSGSGNAPITVTNGVPFQITANNPNISSGAVFTFSAGTLTNVQFEYSGTATPFEYLTFTEQLAKCQRRYFKTYNYSIKPGVDNAGSNVNAPGYISRFVDSSNPFGGLSVYMPVQMDASPSVTIYSGSNGTAGLFSVDGSERAAVVQQASPLNFHARLDNQAIAASQHLTAHFVAEVIL